MKNQKSFFSLPNRNLGLEATYFYGSFSNSGEKTRPTYYGALPAELNPYVAGAEGLEPPTSGLAGKNNCCSGL